MAFEKKQNNNGKNALTLRTMPNHYEAEQAVLGSIMSDNEIANEFVASLSVADFYTPINSTIFEHILKLNKESRPVDIVMVSDSLSKAEQLDEIGGFSMLAEMLQNVFSSANCGEYVKILKQKSLLRSIIRKCNEIISSAYEVEDADKVLAVAESLIYSIAENKDTSSLLHVSVSSTNLLNTLNSQFVNKSTNSTLKVGFENLDEMTGGFVGGQLIILAARPGCGKTSFAMNIVANIAREQPEKVVAVFNLEMSARELVGRLISNIARVDSEKLKDGTNLILSEWTPLWKADAALGQSNIYIDDTAAITVEQIMSKCRRLKSQKGALDLVVVDYLQLMESSNTKVSKQQQVSETSRAFKVLAKELKVPIIVLSQMSRDIENREKAGLDATPKLSDLRESGAIEQDADIVFFLSKGDFELSAQDSGTPIYLIVAKQRNGSTGQLGFSWNKPYTDYLPIKNMIVIPKKENNLESGDKKLSDNSSKNSDLSSDSKANKSGEALSYSDNNDSDDVNMRSQNNSANISQEDINSNEVVQGEVTNGNFDNDFFSNVAPPPEDETGFDALADLHKGTIKTTPKYEDESNN